MIRAVIRVECCICRDGEQIDSAPIHAMPSRRAVYKKAREAGYHYSSLQCNWLCNQCWDDEGARNTR
jgi:hypothetical protein